MKIEIKLDEVIEIKLMSGFYNIYLLGGFNVIEESDFFVEIKNLNTNDVINIKKNYLKIREIKNDKKAIKYFNFELSKIGIYRISMRNYENLIVRKSNLKFFSFNNNDKIDLDNLRILIE